MKIPKWGMVAAVLFVALAMLFMVVPAGATPDIYPCNFYGTAMVDGVPVAAGTGISAWFESVEVASTVTGGGVLADDEYSLVVNLDEVHEGEDVSFKIDTLWANETGTWQRLQFVPVNLTATTPDTDPPTVVGTSPVPGATGVAVTTKVTATFSEDIQEGVNFGDIAISGATGVSATIVGDTLTIAHDAFAYETTYVVTIPAGAVNDLADIPNPLALPYTWSFTTGEDPPPEVVSTVPVDGARGVALGAVVSATFSENIQEGTNFGDIGIGEVTGVSTSIDGDTLTIAHDDFAYNTTYEVTIPAGAVEDLANNPLAEAYTWSFTTGAKPAPPEEVEVEEEEIVSPKPELGPHVSVGNLRISPAEVSLNQPVTISLSVFNSGDRGGSKTLNLLINGELEQSTRVGIPAHGNKSFSFTVQRASPGVYSVYIEGASGWFTVSGLVAPSAPAEAGLGTGDVIAIVIIAIILIGGLTFAFLYARRSA